MQKPGRGGWTGFDWRPDTTGGGEEVGISNNGGLKAWSGELGETVADPSGSGVDGVVLSWGHLESFGGW